MNNQFNKIRNFVYQAIDDRDKRTPERIPSLYWTDFVQHFKYVYELDPNELMRIRFHTYHLTSDIYLTYYFAEDGFKQLMVDGWRYFTEGWQIKPVDETTIGIGVETKFGRVSHDLLRYLGVVCDLKEAKLLDHNSTKYVLEIGGGYGGLARTHLIQNPQTCYIICDIEETLFFSAIYLSILIGSDRVHLVDSRLESKHLEKGHIYVVPQSRIELIDELYIDYAVSQQSLQEMTCHQVEFYIEWLAHHSDYFYSCNLNDHGSIANKKQLVIDLNNKLTHKFSAPEWVGGRPDHNHRFGDNLLSRAVYRCNVR